MKKKEKKRRDKEGTTGFETGRQTGGEREGTVGGMGVDGAPFSLFFGQQPAPPSVALREMERETRR